MSGLVGQRKPESVLASKRSWYGVKRTSETGVDRGRVWWAGCEGTIDWLLVALFGESHANHRNSS